ncbi:acetyltransferase GNAT domain containing protein [Nitzschia inconspicua]|uniref:Acetyltransferase GNAT domain containing protein n=1 Tax=Nitzschia inconspicua TaxID=303405 RepID=A0A9K3KW33_9STRA|nr:acetyltransferase GNAT domain containing protein [Nitzschia inconspicua]
MYCRKLRRIRSPTVHFFATASHAADDTDGVAVGTVQYDPATNRLRQLIVDPAHRRQNLGARMVDAVKTEAIDHHQRDCLKVQAWLDSAPFYARQGFVPRGDVYESNGVLCQVMIYDPKKKGSRDGYIS